MISAFSMVRQVIGFASCERKGTDYVLRVKIGESGFGTVPFEFKGELERIDQHLD